MSYADRYASAVRSANLRSKADTQQSDSDILGAAGLAGKRHALAMALLRLFSGDNHASREIVAELASMAWGKAQAEHVKLKRTQADDMARSVLAWVRDGTCTVCRGHGYEVVGTRELFGEARAVLSDHACKACHGTKKVPFNSAFALERLLIAQWLLAQVEQELARAGSAAMEKLAPRLDVP